VLAPLRYHKKELLALLFFGADYFAALIMTTIWTNGMRRAQFATIAALHQINRHQRILRTASVAAAFRMLSFRMRNHSLSPILILLL
jgi:hypothetical protein